MGEHKEVPQALFPGLSLVVKEDRTNYSKGSKGFSHGNRKNWWRNKRREIRMGRSMANNITISEFEYKF